MKNLGSAWLWLSPLPMICNDASEHFYTVTVFQGFMYVDSFNPAKPFQQLCDKVYDYPRFMHE